jgi:hypothetical protein
MAKATNPGSPQDMLSETMQKLGVGRDAAIYISVRTFEAALRAKTESEADLKQELIRLLHRDIQDATPEAVELAEAGYRKKLPEWVTYNDEAVVGGQDPVTALSIRAKLGMKSAERCVRIVRMHKEGKTIEEITKVMIDESAEKGFEEIWVEALENGI